MSLGILSLIIALYAYQKREVKLTVLSVIGALCGIVGSLLSTARGGWVALPILTYCYTLDLFAIPFQNVFPDFLWNHCRSKRWH